MKKTMKCTTRLIAILLSVIMLLSVIPMQAFATYADNLLAAISDSKDADASEATDTEDTQPQILYEIEEKRDAYVKHYKMSDGTNSAVISSEPLHFMQNGKWEDIDNTWISTVRDGETVYANKNGVSDVSLPEHLSDGAEISVAKDGYTLSFAPQDILPSVLEMQDEQTAEISADAFAQQIPEDINTQSATAKYKNVMSGTDLEYSVSASSVKENILIDRCKDARETYTFSISADGLLGILENDHSVSFLNESGKKVFYIPAPFMKDDAGDFSTNIAVELTDNGNGSYILTYRPDAAWLQAKEREYPVTIDPIIGFEDVSWIQDTCVMFDTPDANYSNDSAAVASNGLLYDDNTGELTYAGGTYETYIKLGLDQLKPLIDGITITDAQLALSGGAYNVAAYEILSDCDIGTVTYNTKPQVGTSVIDYYVGKTDIEDIEFVHFNITKMLYEWLSGEKENNGIAILGYDNTVPGIGLFLNFSSNPNNTYLFLDYVETSGYNDTYDYHTQDVGRAGTSYIHDFTQKLLIKRDDIALSGNIMPVSISFLYNPALLLKTEKTNNIYPPEDGTQLTIPEVYGNHWLTNYNRMVYIDAYTSGILPNISYVTENGSVIHFTAEEQEDGTFQFVEENTTDSGGSGYTLVFDEETAEGPQDIQIQTPNGETEIFDECGRLIKIYREKYPDQSVNIVYVGDFVSDMNLYAIDYITDGVGRKFDFVYDAQSGLLQNIQCFAADGTAIKGGSTSLNLKMTYGYDENGNLTKVSFPDGASAYYQYDANGRMTVANSRNMYKLTYTYDDFGRVHEISESAQDISTLSGYTLGNVITITPEEPYQVTFRDESGTCETIQFDKCGRTVLVTDARGNYVEADSGVQRTASQNLLANQSFENGWQSWEHDSDKVMSIVDTDAHSGTHSVKFASETATTASFDQVVPVTESGTYTFSAFIRAQNSLSDMQKIAMMFVALDDTNAVIDSVTRTVAATSSDYTRYSVTLRVPENAAKLGVYLGFVDTAGTFYADSLQLEKGSGFGAYNILDNSSFDEQSGGKALGWAGNADYTLQAQTVNTAACGTASFPAAPNAAYSLSQTVAIDGKAGDMLTFGGWMKADIVSNAPDCRLAQLAPDQTDFLDDRFAGVVLTYTYTAQEDGKIVTKTETVRKSIRNFISDWQFVSDSVILQGDCTEVTFSFEYTKHADAVCVAMPHLSFEKMSYSAQEEILPDGSDENTQPEETPDPDDTCPCADCGRLGCTCRCASEEVCDCLQCKKLFDITYDEFGNLKSLSMWGYDADDLLKMLMARTFSASGNYMTSATNESGGTVTYAYNEQNGVLDSETDARGNVTEYSYNAMGALRQVKTPVSGLAKELLGLVTPTSMVTNYAYLNDQVVTIQHNDFAYYIDYDRWNNVDRIYANELNAALGALGDTYVAKYTYGTGVNHSRLEGISYGNGGTVHYRYDEYGHIVGISYDGGKTDRFVYGYDALGNVIYIHDAQLSRTVLYNENSMEVYDNGDLLYYCGVNADGDQVEYNGDEFVTVTKKTEKTRNEETHETSSKKEIVAKDVTVQLLKSADAFGRTQEKTTVLLQNGENGADTSLPFAAAVTDYTFLTGEDGGETVAQGRVDTMRTRLSYGTSILQGETKGEYGFAYSYDANGNITHEYAVDANGARTLRYRYVYDEANQLVRVDDAVQKKTFAYQYDKGGNRVSEKIYAYTAAQLPDTPEKEIKSAYNFLQWKDRISSYDGKSIKYDSAGNPTAYGDQKYVWNGKQLVEIDNPDGTKTTFAYDADGLRTEKRQFKADGKEEYVVYYIWKDGVLTQQYLIYHIKLTVQGVTRYADLPFFVEFLLDENNQSQGCIINGEQAYMFVRNMQGDVIALADEKGNALVEYNYDPWGKITCTYLGEGEGADQTTLRMFTAILCPLTYRGYNYDFTTGLYYLQSRYYNPEWGRFLNCDDTSILLATQGETHGANMFAYCGNNPVNMVDPSGYKAYTEEEKAKYIYAGIASVKYLEDNGYYNAHSDELVGFECTENSHGILISRLAFLNKWKQYICYKVAIGLLSDWASYDNRRPRTKQELDAFKEKMRNDLYMSMSGNFGVLSKAMESSEGYIMTRVFYGVGNLMVEVGVLSLETSDDYHSRHTYSAESYIYQAEKYYGMYAIARRKIKLTKKGRDEFLSDDSMPKYSDIETFGGI